MILYTGGLNESGFRVITEHSNWLIIDSAVFPITKPDIPVLDIEPRITKSISLLITYSGNTSLGSPSVSVHQ